MPTKYYLKEKCKFVHSSSLMWCPDCNGKGFTRGTDVTELIERIKSKIISHINSLDHSKGWLTEWNIENSLKDLIEVVEEKDG